MFKTFSDSSAQPTTRKQKRDTQRPPPLFAPTLLATSVSPADSGSSSRVDSFSSPVFSDLPLSDQCRLVLVDWIENLAPAAVVDSIRPKLTHSGAAKTGHGAAGRGHRRESSMTSLPLPPHSSMPGAARSRRDGANTVRAAAAAVGTWITGPLARGLIIAWRLVIAFLRFAVAVLATACVSLGGTVVFVASYWAPDWAKSRLRSTAGGRGSHVRPTDSHGSHKSGDARHRRGAGGGAGGHSKMMRATDDAATDDGDAHGLNSAPSGGLRQRHAHKGGDSERGPAADKSPPSERRRRFVVSILGSPDPDDSDSGTNDNDDDDEDEMLVLDDDERFFRRHSSTFYYDVEEASYQPTARLLFGLFRVFGGGNGESHHQQQAAPGHRRSFSSEFFNLNGEGGATENAAHAAQLAASSTSSLHAILAATRRTGTGVGTPVLLSAHGGGADRGETPPALSLPVASPLMPPAGATSEAGASSFVSDGTPPELVAEGYFAGRFGMLVNGGAFQLVALIGRGAYSTVWLAIDRKGVTQKTSSNLLLRYRQSSKSYNATGIVSRNVPAYVVLKISKALRHFVSACEEEYNVSRRLAKELQKRRLPVALMSLYAMSFIERRDERPAGAGAGAAGAAAASAAVAAADAADHHFVMVADVCGPSLLQFVTDASPRACAAPADQLWRLRFVKELMRQMLRALAALHECRVVSSDVKPENSLFALPAPEVLAKMSATITVADQVVAQHRFGLMVSRSLWRDVQRRHEEDLGHMEAADVVALAAQSKLADFGNSIADRPKRPAAQASVGRRASPMRLMQTREYRSPEVILRLPDSFSVTCAMDVWSAACLAFELLTGDYLFNVRRFLVQRAVLAAREAFVASHPSRASDEAALQEVMDAAARRVDGDTPEGDAVHLAMMEELLQRKIPDEMRAPCPLQELGGAPGAAKHDDAALEVVCGDDNTSDPDEAAEAEAGDGSSTLLPVLLYEALVKPHAVTGSHERDIARLREEVLRAADFIATGLVIDPRRRATASQLLRHRWLRDDSDWADDTHNN